jgi:pimeloyl-ACP methyl ester carboxylesterase
VRIRNPILIDLPGWGAATLTDRGEQVAIEAVCTLVKDCAEQLGYTEWDIVGHSMGGFIALHMASIWPKSVRTVGIVSGTGRSIIRSVEHPVRNFGVLPAFTLLWRAMIVLAALGPAGPRLIRWLRSAGLLRPVVSPLFRHARRIDRSVIDALGDELRPRPFVLAAEIARGYDADGRWARIECPVRALNGDRDVFSTRGDLDQLARTVHATVLTVIDDCGHFAAVERPGEVLVALGFTAGEQGSPTACAGPAR